MAGPGVHWKQVWKNVAGHFGDTPSTGGQDAPSLPMALEPTEDTPKPLRIPSTKNPLSFFCSHGNSEAKRNRDSSLESQEPFGCGQSLNLLERVHSSAPWEHEGMSQGTKPAAGKG